MWGGGAGGAHSDIFIKKIKTPPRKQIREFSVPIKNFTCHQISGFSGSIFSAKKSLGGVWVGGGGGGM
jgi:hypothetical protein